MPGHLFINLLFYLHAMDTLCMTIVFKGNATLPPPGVAKILVVCLFI